MKPTALHKVLIIQTAFIGDVVLATPLIEALYAETPGIQIDFLLRKGNESLFLNHPKLRRILIWDKKNNKSKNLFKIINTVRKENYDVVFNAQRFFSSGLITLFSKAKYTVGFNKNPLSFTFGESIKHEIFAQNNIHETQRNLKLLEGFGHFNKPSIKLYPTEDNFLAMKKYKKEDYLVIAPSSVWFTKQFPVSKWVDLLISLQEQFIIYLIGGPDDKAQAEEIIIKSKSTKCVNLCGQLTMLQSAALMQDAKMNYVNDSAPLHFASAMNAPVSAVYCSTIPSFGFGPISNKANIIEIEEQLNCRPCGLHGKRSCPEGHFRCGLNIKNKQLLKVLE